MNDVGVEVLCVRVCFCESAKEKSRMRNIRMACLDNSHSLRILLPGHHFSSKKNILSRAEGLHSAKTTT